MPRSREPKPFNDPELWQPGTGEHTGLWKCSACTSTKWRLRENALKHEKTRIHREAARAARRARQQRATTPMNQARNSSVTPADLHTPEPHVGGALLSVLRDWQEMQGTPDGEVSNTDYNGDVDDETEPAHSSTFDFSSLEGITLSAQPDQAALEHMSQALTEWLLQGPRVGMNTYSDDELNEDHASTPEDPPSEHEGPGSLDSNNDPDEAKHWFPWPNKIVCVLDILQHLPRASFSDKQYDIIRWALQVLDIPNVPAPWTMKNTDAILQELCGIKTMRYQGSLGHVYYVNDLAGIIAQELANPEVRPHLRFRPQDTGHRLSEAYQALRWLTEMDASLTTPMVRMRKQDFYLFEPAMLIQEEICMPVRWFDRGSDVFAEVCPMRVVEHPTNGRGWVVFGSEKTVVPATSFLTSFPRLCDSFAARGLHDVRNIIGFMPPRHQGGSTSTSSFERWTLTDPSQGNRWRALARGHQVYAFPIWLYCNDTSGNLSKRWNKHNSFLFTAAGLPREHVNREFNVHFLATSNLAPPLEMLDGIVEQLEQGQSEGIWAWDCLEQEMVLLIPSVLALLGDNPMQSELACHVGLTGKFFCRACFAKGKDKADDSSDADSARPHEQREGAPDSAGSEFTTDAMSATSQASSTHGSTQRGKKRVKETMAQLVSRARRFMTIGKKRERAETMETLRSVFAEASIVGGQTRSKELKTGTGVKDTYQEHFSSLIFKFVTRLRGSIPSKQAQLDQFLKTIPSDPMSPVWRIKGLDPHQDTPVEILHVILLGFVKYFWRDAISRLKAPQKEVLAVRLSSLNVAGLNIPRIAGRTLVQYAGSLTGRDFRVIAQVAPFVLYDLVPKECFDAWLALSALVPLVWQPEIDDVESHLASLEFLIEHFLNCTARWTPRWFNKPKFHIVLHLPRHIRRFGPAALFATETFESFNAVIRGYSIHSNRQAPSHDIGQSFARANRTRHLLSRGVFRRYTKLDKRHVRRSQSETVRDAATQKHPSEFTASDFCTIGEGPRRLLQDNSKLRDFLGFPPIDTPPSLAKQRHPEMPWSKTLSSSFIPTELVRRAHLHTFTYRACDSSSLQNGDKCSLGSWILARNPEHEQSIPFVGQVAEILQIPSSSSVAQNRPDLILVRMALTKSAENNYGMPQLELTASYSLFNFTDVYCTVNVQHNCAANACPIHHERVVRQERKEISERAEVVSHVNAADLVLNTAQMRDSRFVSKLQQQPTPIDREFAIHAGSAAELASQRRSNNPSSQRSSSGTRSGAASGQHGALRPSRLSTVSAMPEGSTISH